MGDHDDQQQQQQQNEASDEGQAKARVVKREMVEIPPVDIPDDAFAEFDDDEEVRNVSRTPCHGLSISASHLPPFHADNLLQTILLSFHSLLWAVVQEVDINHARISDMAPVQRFKKLKVCDAVIDDDGGGGSVCGSVLHPFERDDYWDQPHRNAYATCRLLFCSHGYH